jgi:YVTN family beta-propeller protein
MAAVEPLMGGGVASSTRGFLFADLRGYTRFADSRGDRAAAALLATYRTVVRGVIARLDGGEIRTEGDSFYVVFPSASSALEAGLAILREGAVASTPDLPLRIGVGVHAGETVDTDEGLVGTAVNIAARVCAAADAGELLATDTVRSLTRTLVAYRFVPLGPHRLKGVDESIPLFRVEAVGVRSGAHLRRRLRSRRRRLVGIAAAAVLALVALGGAYAATRPVPCLTVDPGLHDVAVKVDPQRACVVEVVPVGRRPTSIVAVQDAVWVGSSTDQTVTIHDLATGEDQVTSADGAPDALAVGDNNVWVLHVTDGRVSGIDIASRHVVSQYPVPADPSLEGATNGHGYGDIATTRGRLWLPNRLTGQVVKMDQTNRVAWTLIQVDAPGQFRPGFAPFLAPGTGPIAAAEGTIWVANTDGPGLWRLDAGAARPSAVSVPDHGASHAILAALGSVWTAHGDGTVVRIAEHGSATVIKVGRDPVRLTADSSSVWVADARDGTVSRIDAATNRVVSSVVVGNQPHGIAAVDGSVWVAVTGP